MRNSKQMISGILVIVILLETMIQNINVIHAATTDNIQLWYASTKDTGVIDELIAGYDHGKVLYAIIDNNVAYCMNYGLSVSGGDLMTLNNKRRTDLSDNQQLLLDYCLYFGFSDKSGTAPSDSDKNKFLATQALVWIICEGVFPNRTNSNSAAKTICNSAPDPDASYEYYKTVYGDIYTNYYAEIPSFAGSSILNIKKYLMKWNVDNSRYEVMVTDSNSALKDFNFSASGISTSISGNKITFYTTKAIDDPVMGTFRSKVSMVQIVDSVYFWLVDGDTQGKSQEFCSTSPDVDPLSAFIRLDTEPVGYGKVVKKDVGTGTLLKGAVYGIYEEKACTTEIQRLTTGANGSATSKILPVGTYYAKEIKAPTGFRLNKTVYTLSIKADQTTTIQATDTEQLGKLTIEKIGEKLTDYANQQFVYEMGSISGAAFTLKAAEDIEGHDGELLYATGDIVKDALITDGTGSVSVDKLKLGKYEIVEKRAPDGFQRGESKIVTISYTNQNEAVSFVSEKIENNRQKLSLDIIKLNEATGKPLGGAVFGLYAQNDIWDYNKTKCIVSAGTLLETVTTNAEGKGAFQSDLPSGYTYVVKEIQAPSGYVRSKEQFTFFFPYLPQDEIKQAFSYTFANKEQVGSLTIAKVGEVLESFQNEKFHYRRSPLKDAVFQVRAGADIYKPDGRKMHSKGDIVVDNLRTNASGVVIQNNLTLGVYEVEEIQAPNGYKRTDEIKQVTIGYTNQDAEVSFMSTEVENARQTASVDIVKLDNLTRNGLIGGHYGIYAGQDIRNHNGVTIVKKDALIEGVITDKNGKASFLCDIPVQNSYYIKEIQAPYGYTRTSDTYPFTFSYLPQNEISISFAKTFENERVSGKIKLLKHDKELGTNNPQGDGRLDNAVYGLYAKTDIIHPDGVTGVMYKANAQVALLTTNMQGKAEIDNLYLGEYFVKEITPPEGYLIDEAVYQVAFLYEGDFQVVIEKSMISKEQVKKQPFQIIKAAQNGQTDAEVISGAGFTAYLKSTLKKKSNGHYDYENAQPVVVTKDGETEMFTDSKGHAASIPLPYGVYVVRESTVPHNYKPVADFEVTVREDKPNEVQLWRVLLDEEFSAKLRIIKKDALSGRNVLVPKAEFKIFNEDTGKYVEQITTYPSKVVHKSFFTDEDGDLVLPNTLPIGRYRIEEVKAPEGYIISTRYIKFEVDTNTFYQIDPDTWEAVIDIEYQNMPALGELEIIKTGEVLQGYFGALFSESQDRDFVYEIKNLAGAKFDIYAAEDIYTEDYQMVGGKRILHYAKNELVAELVTNQDGKAGMKGLPMGKYKIVETKAPDGFLLATQQSVDFIYIDDQTPIVYESAHFLNERQKIELTIIKKNSETEKPLKGAEFGLYAKEDIKNADGDIRVEADTLIELAESDENGRVEFTKDLPLGKYYAKETKYPAGFVTSSQVIEFDATYRPEHRTIELEYECENTPTTVEFTKTDITSGKELTGAVMAVLDENRNVIETWVSDAEHPHIIKQLQVGKEYILREDLAPKGYLQASEIHFTIQDTGQVQKVVMRDEVAKGMLVIEKFGEELDYLSESSHASIEGQALPQFEYTTKRQAGVTFLLYAREDIVSFDGLGTVYYKKDQLVDTLITDSAGMVIKRDLPLGKYYLVEKQPPEGHILTNKPIPFDLNYINQNMEYVWHGEEVYNQRQKIKVQVHKKDGENKKALEGAVFGLFAGEDIYNYKRQLLVEKGSQIDEAISDKTGSASFTADIPHGKYFVREMAAPAGYAVSDKIYEFEAVYDKPTAEFLTFEHTFYNQPTEVQIVKTDITSGKELTGAVMELLDADRNVIEAWVSDAEHPHVIKRLEVGKEYILREDLAPIGYLQASEIRFTVKDTGEVQKIEMRDEVAKGRLLIEKYGDELEHLTASTHSGIGVHHFSQFSYIQKRQEGVTFLLYAREDIVSFNGLGTVYYKKDQLVDTLTTDSLGMIKKDLPLGKYYLVEKQPPEGHILPDKPIHFDLDYVNQNTEYVVHGEEIHNQRQKIKVQVHKKDGENDQSLAGAVFGLFAGEDIYNDKSQLEAEKGSQIDEAVTDETGSASFTADISHGKYFVKEVAAPAGYIGSDEIFEFEAVYDEPTEETLTFEHTFINQPTVVQIVKTDVTSGRELTGASLTLFDSSGSAIDSWISNAEKPHVIKRLEVGREYVLRETLAPHGYLQAEEIRFTVQNTAEIQKVEMKDAVPKGGIIIEKFGEALSYRTLRPIGNEEFVYGMGYKKARLPDAVFWLFAKEDVVSPDNSNEVYYKKDQLVDILTTDQHGLIIKNNLPLGKYYVIEKQAPLGYVLSDKQYDFDLSYVDQSTELVVDGAQIDNVRQKIEVSLHKKESGTNKALKGAVFGLYADEDIRSRSGEIIIEKGTKLDEVKTDAEGNASFTADLVHGKYFVKEITPPSGYVLSDEIFRFEAVYEEQTVTVLKFKHTFNNQPTKVEIVKTDASGYLLKGAYLEILDKKGKVIKKWKTSGKAELIKGLPKGSYVLREYKAPAGYLIAKDKGFTVTGSGRTAKVIMRDERPYGKIIIKKRDKHSGKPLQGVIFEVRNGDGKLMEIIKTNKSGVGTSKRKYEIGEYKKGAFVRQKRYYVIEVKPRTGYKPDNQRHWVKFAYRDVKSKIVTYTLNVKNEKRPNPGLPQTWQDRYVMLYAFGGVLLSLLGVFTWKGRGGYRKRVKREK